MKTFLYWFLLKGNEEVNENSIKSFWLILPPFPQLALMLLTKTTLYQISCYSLTSKDNYDILSTVKYLLLLLISIGILLIFYNIYVFSNVPRTNTFQGLSFQTPIYQGPVGKDDDEWLFRMTGISGHVVASRSGF